jgi:hypothetical protein
MSIHFFNQPDPNAPIDGDRLDAEFQEGLEAGLEIPLTQTHLACLCVTAQAALCLPDCPPPVATVLLDFLAFCAREADFGIETRKLLQRSACMRNLSSS